MKAIQYIAGGAALEERAVAEREPADGAVVVEIRACGICHSDAHYRAGFGSVATPRTLGHEIAGVVAGTGQRVAVHYLLPDGRMIGKECDGGYAERIIVPAENVVPVPDNVPLE